MKEKKTEKKSREEKKQIRREIRERGECPHFLYSSGRRRGSIIVLTFCSVDAMLQAT